MNRQGEAASGRARRPFAAAAAALFFLLVAGLPALPRAAAAAAGYEREFALLAGMAPDPSRVAVVHGLKLKRDVATFDFTDGQIALLGPVEGRVWGAVFAGRGTFSFRPPTEIERDQLHRFYETDSLVAKFESLVLLFADTTLVELASQAKFVRGAVDKRADSAMRKGLDLLLDRKTMDINYAVGKTCLEGAANELFFAYIEESGSSKSLIFEIDPSLTEQVQLWRPFRSRIFQSRVKNREIICQFPLEADRERGAIPGCDFVPSYDDDHYRILTRFDGALRLAGATELSFHSLEGGQNWIAMALDQDLVVDGVQWEHGEEADYFKGKNALLLWVRCDHPLALGEARTLRIRYHGRVVWREDDWVHFDPADFWFPRLVPYLRATYDLEFEYPASYTLASVGDPSPIERNGNAARSVWKVSVPTAECSFMLGIYKEHRIQAERVPPVTVLMSESAHRQVRDTAGESLIEQGLAPGRSMEKQVGADVANSLAYFQSLYGPTPLRQFYVAENPFGDSYLGVASPGLIQLDRSTFYTTEAGGFDEVLRAHEVAHQWWGALGVLPATYHDQWLAEAFAHFSALRYLEAASKDNKRFLDALRQSRERLIKNRKFLLGAGQEAGPIWLGPRTSTSTTREDHFLVIYQKGAWVLHMLRNLFLNLDTMKDGGFDNIMREFYGSYAEKDATTADFQRVVEKYAGRNMSWFFREWVYGTGIPHYKFAWRAVPGADGKFKVTCRVDQENVPEDFQMFVPLRIDFGDAKFARVRVFVKGGHSEFALPPLPMEPKGIVFNDLESVLCDVEA
ncbi:MAG TPA: M1 family aminopeptidase, partial [Candidatus Eisenbacteria bacterium]|nr:M1 family aminopeptidase [Candidatus Eisenbacteria bacterium]